MDINNTKIILEISAIVLGIFGTLFPAYRWMNKKIRERKEEEQKKDALRQQHAEVSKQTLIKLEDMDVRLKNVESEIMLSDGSIKDFIHTIKAEMDVSNWLNARPMFRTTGKGLHIFVNEAYTQICKCKRDDLLSLGWKNFFETSEEADQFHQRWMEFTTELTQFKGVAKIVSHDGEDRGKWTVVIKPLGTITVERKKIQDGNVTKEDVAEYIWHGVLAPKDEIAKKIAEELGIPK